MAVRYVLLKIHITSTKEVILDQEVENILKDGSPSREAEVEAKVILLKVGQKAGLKVDQKAGQRVVHKWMFSCYYYYFGPPV